LKQITFEEGMLQENDSTPDEDRFDADVALATGELGTLLADLIDALDGAAAEPSLQGAAAVAK
jgi:recombination associated protein RdgC